MIKHITDKSSNVGATGILALIAEHGGEWIVNAVDNEGYIVMRDGTSYAAQLRRSGSPNLCGPFRAGDSYDTIKTALRAARTVEWSPRKEPPMGGLKLEAFEALAGGEMSSVEIAARINANAQSVSRALRELAASRHVRRVGFRRRIPTGQAPMVYAQVTA